jgi:PST family polysaccharide transporter
MSEMVRSVGMLSAQRFGTALLGALRTKIAAAVLGPAGMGLLAQATTVQELLGQTANLGTSRGFLKLAAESRGRDNPRDLARLIETSVAVVGGLAAAIALICIVFARPIAWRVFGEGDYALLVVLTGITVLASVPADLVSRVLNGLLEFRAFAVLGLAQALLSALAMAVLAPIFGLPGAVGSFLAAEACGIVVAVAVFRSRVGRPLGVSFRFARPHGETARKLARYAGALTLSSLSASVAAVFVRGEMIRRLGSEANGYYQVAWQVGQNYLGILGASLWTYGMPKVATQLHDERAIVGLQNAFLRIGLLVLAPGIVLLLVARELWIPILYTRGFLAAGPLLAWQLAGELGAMLRQSLNISLLPRDRLRFLVAQAIGYWGGFALLSWSLLDRLGPVAVALSYCAMNLIVLVWCFVYHRRSLGFALDAQSRRLAWTTLPGFAVAVALSQSGDRLIGTLAPLALLAAWLLWNGRLVATAVGGLWRRAES